MYTRKNGRLTYRANRKQGFRKTHNFSDGRVRHKGNIVQQYQKYLKHCKYYRRLLTLFLFLFGSLDKETIFNLPS